MVKIKAGYVMSPREQVEYERVDALPRKTSGSVAYYYKPQTKYPPRIYVFMHSEIWQDRNRRPMGLFHAYPFLTRPMNSEEIEYHHFDTRLCYHQYEDWGKLIYAEEQEAAQLDTEKPGLGTAFLAKLKTFQQTYRMSQPPPVEAPKAPEPEESEEMRDLKALLGKAGEMSATEVGRLLDEEQQGCKRLTILILLREMYKEVAGAPNQLAQLTPEVIQKKADRSQLRSRRNFVKRVFRDNPLFAMAEIRLRYPEYDVDQLAADLKRKPPKPKRPKVKPVLDLRRVQLQKMARLLEDTATDDRKYHHLCQQMAIMEQAHRLRLPIPLSVKLEQKTVVYYFHWKTLETVVKSFQVFANKPGQTHGALQQRHQEIISSSYSF